MLFRSVLAHRGTLEKIRVQIGGTADWPIIMSLRLACLFHRSRGPLVLPPIQAGLRDRAFEVDLPADWRRRYPLTAAALRSEIREWRAIGFELSIPSLDDVEAGFDPAAD